MPSSFTPQQIEQFLQEFFDVVGARQYVGARYVPIFGRAGSDTVEWDDGAPYEPLTVVMHEGVSYVSRRYVPTGIQITDTDYWVETYRFNAQVEQYRQEVLGFQSQIDQIRDDLESDYVPFPIPTVYPKYGTTGQVLTTLSNGETKWEDPVTVDAAIAEPLVEAWLDDHPEATTTVQDHSITNVKFTEQLEYLNQIYRGYVTAGSNLNSYQKEGTFVINLTAQDYATVQNAPDLESLGVTSGPVALFMDVIHTTARDDGGLLCQRIYTSGFGVADAAYCPTNTIIRWGNSTNNVMNWSSWYIESYTKVGVDALVKKSPYVRSIAANTDLNDVQESGCYLINLSTAQYETLLNKPTLNDIKDPTGLWLEVMHSSVTANQGVVKQVLYCGGFFTEAGNNTAMYRNGVRSGDTFTWTSWVPFSRRTDYFVSIPANSDLNDYQREGKYLINRSVAEYATIANAPDLDKFNVDAPTALFMEVTTNAIPANTGLVCQRIHCSGYVYGANLTNTLVRWGNYVNGQFQWFDWVQESSTANAKGRVVRVGANRYYTSLLEGIIEAERYKDATVIVDPGVYNMTDEFEALYGNDYFTNASYASQQNHRGCPLKNGVHVIGYGNVVVTGGLESTDQADALELWSIFNAGDDAGGSNGYGFTLENLTIRPTNEYFRYLIHDEYGATDYDYINKYKNCHFDLPVGIDKNCIGGGLGKHAYIEIEGCTLVAPAYTSTRRGINYHNNRDAGSLSEIYVKNCYIPNGTVGITWYGDTPATEKSMLYVSNCTLQHEPIKMAETPASTNENVDIVAWNNEIVS